MKEENTLSEIKIFCPYCQSILEAKPPYQNVICSTCKCFVHFGKKKIMKILCPCGKRLLIPAKYIGKPGKCTQCNQDICAPLFTIQFDESISVVEENLEFKKIDFLPEPVKKDSQTNSIAQVSPYPQDTFKNINNRTGYIFIPKHVKEEMRRGKKGARNIVWLCMGCLLVLSLLFYLWNMPKKEKSKKIPSAKENTFRKEKVPIETKNPVEESMVRVEKEAQENMARGNWDIALEKYNRLYPFCKKDYQKARIGMEIGFIYEKKKEWYLAKEYYEQALSLDKSLAGKIQERLEWIQQTIREKEAREENLIQEIHASYKEMSKGISRWNENWLLIESMQKDLQILEFIKQGQEAWDSLLCEKGSICKKIQQKEKEYKALLLDIEKLPGLESLYQENLALQKEIENLIEKTKIFYQTCQKEKQEAIEEKELEQAFILQDIDVKWYLYLQTHPEKKQYCDSLLQNLKMQKWDQNTLKALRDRISPLEKQSRIFYRLLHHYLSQWIKEDIVPVNTEILFDRIETNDGRILYGKIIKEDKESIEMEIEERNIRGSTHIPKYQLLSRKKVPGEDPKLKYAKSQFLLLIDFLSKKDYTNALKYAEFFETFEKECPIFFSKDIYQQRLLLWENCPEFLFQFSAPFVLSVQKMLYPLKVCSSCHGNKVIFCDVCRGRGYIECSQCKGSGKIYKEEERTSEHFCLQCNGTGKLKKQMAQIDMTGKHKGFYIETVIVPCDACQGTGKYQVRYKFRKVYECHFCNGKGNLSCPGCLSKKYFDCHDCQNTGFDLSDSYTKKFLEAIK